MSYQKGHFVFSLDGRNATTQISKSERNRNKTSERLDGERALIAALDSTALTLFSLHLELALGLTASFSPPSKSKRKEKSMTPQHKSSLMDDAPVGSRIVLTMLAFIWFPYMTLIVLVIQYVLVGIGMGFGTGTGPGPGVEAFTTVTSDRQRTTTTYGTSTTSRTTTSTTMNSASSVDGVGHDDVTSKQPYSLLEAPSKPWYSHPDIGRDRSHILGVYNDHADDKSEQLTDRFADSRFLLTTPNGMYSNMTTITTTTHTTTTTSTTTTVIPLYLSPTEMDDILVSSGNPTLEDLLAGLSGTANDFQQPLLAWVGSHNGIDYWVVHLWKDLTADVRSVLSLSKTHSTVDCKPLREFGDVLESSLHAGIAATANGLVEFHKSHRYCTSCGSRTVAAKAGSCRQCTNKPDCRKSRSSIYPRIDVATIMLITSPCEQYALLGRKANWPTGRYSTLAGFCEVGETLEECCIRETLEESGVVVEPSSVKFIASQPWPFPRSLMVGFHAQAKVDDDRITTTVTTTGRVDNDNGDEDVDKGNEDQIHGPSLPRIVIDTNEMEDIKWFDKDFVRRGLALAGSTALSHQPDDEEAVFHIPGRSSLARVLISKWALED